MGRLLIRVYGDSLSMPREDEGIEYFRTYPELVKAFYQSKKPDTPVHLYNRSQGGKDILWLFTQYTRDCRYFGDSARGILIIQCGIVDCAPRPVPTKLRKLIGRLPSRHVRSKIIAFLHNHRAIIQRSIRYTFRITQPAAFRSLYGSSRESVQERRG